MSLLGLNGLRLDRDGAARVMRRAARRAGIAKLIGPHTIRHPFTTGASSFDADVPLRAVQEAASRGDPRTTMGYDRARGSLHGHATYMASTSIVGAAR